jgi:protein-S-isoprenylcysteine O-methyltransferase Ste14
MDTQQAAALAIAGYGVFLFLAFGVRSLVQWRRTGSTGFVGFSGRPGSAEWWGGVLFALAVVAGGAAPVLQLAGVLSPATGFVRPELQWAGIVLFAAGIAGTLWSQLTMGDSWRVGVNRAEKTALVVAGPFRWVRNPIFTAMTTATLGLALLVPNVAAFAAVASLVLALELQVRLVEEPYLRRTHGESYARYASSAGRFLPGIGRLA